MLPIVCTVCRTLLGDKQLYYERRLNAICQDEKIGKYKSKKEVDDAKIELIKELGLRKYCCKMPVMTYVKIIEIVK